MQHDTGPIANYLRTHRKRAGLSQRELAGLLGYTDEGAISRHEQSQTLPPLLIAISYEIIFKAPVSALFPGIHGTLQEGIEDRLLELEHELGQRSARGATAPFVAQKLLWLYERHANSEA
jgi:DNA-binding XRE family transcriptional regulator